MSEIFSEISKQEYDSGLSERVTTDNIFMDEVYKLRSETVAKFQLNPEIIHIEYDIIALSIKYSVGRYAVLNYAIQSFDAPAVNRNHFIITFSQDSIAYNKHGAVTLRSYLSNTSGDKWNDVLIESMSANNTVALV